MRVGICPKNNMGYIDFAVGRRYGRAFRYEFIEDESGIHLGNEKLLGMS